MKSQASELGTWSREGAGTGGAPAPDVGRCSTPGQRAAPRSSPLIAPSSHLHDTTVARFLKLSPLLLPSSGKTSQNARMMGIWSLTGARVVLGSRHTHLIKAAEPPLCTRK